MSLFLTPRNKDGNQAALPEPFRLESGEAIIGRGADAQLVLANPAVSRRHCVISGQGSNWQVVDTSTGGTLVNGQRIAGPQALRNGDVLTIAEVEVTVAIENGRASGGRMNLDSWQRGPAAPPPPPPPPAGPGAWEQTQHPAALRPATQNPGTQHPAVQHAVAQQPVAPQTAALHGSPSGPAAQLLQAAGLQRGQIQATDEQVLAAAGTMLRASIVGLSAMLQARRKARTEMGVKDGGKVPGPLESDASPLEILVRLLMTAPASAAESVSAACREIEDHERATLAAMQAAFATALDQFAPEAIKLRASSDAAAWKAYEQAFGAADGFVDAFARELAKALSS